MGRIPGKTFGQIRTDVRKSLLEHAAPSELALADYRGKVVLVNYWYPSCGPCRAQDPFLQQTLRKLGASQIAVLAINTEPSEEKLVLPYILGNGYYFTLFGPPAPRTMRPRIS